MVYDYKMTIEPVADPVLLRRTGGVHKAVGFSGCVDDLGICLGLRLMDEQVMRDEKV